MIQGILLIEMALGKGMTRGTLEGLMTQESLGGNMIQEGVMRIIGDRMINEGLMMIREDNMIKEIREGLMTREILEGLMMIREDNMIKEILEDLMMTLEANMTQGIQEGLTMILEANTTLETAKITLVSLIKEIMLHQPMTGTTIR